MEQYQWIIMVLLIHLDCFAVSCCVLEISEL